MPSWWNSLDAVTTVNWWLGCLLVVFGVLTAATSVMGWVTSSRLATLQGEKEVEMRRRLDEAEERLRHRSLTAEQRTRLIELLRGEPKGSIRVLTTQGDKESIAFGEEMAGVLREAGWTVEGHGVTLVAGVIFEPGLHLYIRNSKNNPARAGSLQRALKSIGFPADGFANERLVEEGEELSIVVGPKP